MLIPHATPWSIPIPSNPFTFSTTVQHPSKYGFIWSIEHLGPCVAPRSYIIKRSTCVKEEKCLLRPNMWHFINIITSSLIIDTIAALKLKFWIHRPTNGLSTEARNRQVEWNHLRQTGDLWKDLFWSRVNKLFALIGLRGIVLSTNHAPKYSSGGEVYWTQAFSTQSPFLLTSLESSQT